MMLLIHPIHDNKVLASVNHDKTGMRPEIRFEGVEGNWEQRKLGDILIERNIQHPQSEEYPLVSFTVEKGVTPKTERYEREQLVKGDKKTKNYKETCMDDIVYNPANLKFGAIARNKFGNAVFSPIYVTYEVDKTRALPEFVEMQVTRNSFIQNALQYQQGTVYERMSVNTEDFATLDIILPSKEEQRKIATFLSALDTKIEKENETVEKLKAIKQTMLQKMFPKEGERVPEIRFPGFTGDWEQRKLGDVGTTYTGLSGKTKDDFGHGEARFVTYMNVYSNAIADPTMVEPIEIDNKQKQVEVGDVFFTTSSETPDEVGMSSVLLEKQGPTYLNSFCFGYRPTEKIDPYYLAYMLRSEAVRKNIILLAQGISRYNISKNKMMEIEIPIPSLSEQEIIGAYFRDLDNLITLHQRKCEKIEQIKTSLLNKIIL